MGDLMERKDLVKQGIKGLGGVGGGITLLVLKGIASRGAGISIPGLIAGGAVVLVGMVISSSREDRNAGLITVAAGAATAAASLPLVGGIAGWLMSLAGILLIGGGAFSLYKFWTNMRRRT